ncbi:NupC/NupG family nucleoside CNT transporter [Ectothiorhodospira variabilis]|uniref:NupC/NupG family nucleoside CNT transporter n=1 Tax=Ectothiorhodospira variabilis TaxID=505694 RepID=UPI001EFC1E6B|nr:nucleoside:proton symporter [Ectothiorhodospira variabilis]MCG5504117.1 nucleoside:proton symporter [Ectothiorhodospira variabilis]MCG5507272.1 nucleoside:proton symporter [Ectothiorhodospira variabilis]
MLMLQGVLGLAVFIGMAWLLSEDRRRMPWRAVAAGLGLQFGLAALLLWVPGGRHLFLWANELVIALSEATEAGTAFVFGYLGGAELPFEAEGAGQAFVFAFQALPLILVMSALSALLFHWRVLPLIIRGASLVLERSFGIGGALGVGTAANVFLGMVESPLLVRPYLARMTRSELFALMTVGMATLAGTMLVLYATFIGHVLDDALGHLIIASVISLPAALLIATVMVPPTGPATQGALDESLDRAAGAMDAITRGTLRGLELLLQIVALLVVLIALVALANGLLGLLPAVGGTDLSLERLLGWVMAPLAWLMGIPWHEAQVAGSLLGIKTILNEMLAFLQLAQLDSHVLSPRSELILIYALSGFANLGSLGILIGGLGAMVPERRGEVVALGMRALVAGTLATLMTGAVVGLLTPWNG